MLDTLDPSAATTAAPREAKLVVASHLKGGIGNQLFQHVFATGLARRLGAEVVSDVSFFSADPYNNQSVLRHFAPQAKTALVGQMAGEGTYLLRDGQIRHLNDQVPLPAGARVLVLDGYWQDERLLDRQVVDEVYASISASLAETARSAVAQTIASHADAIAVHLRRRDYGHMGVCRESYYTGAIDFIRASHPGAPLFVFSDEPNFAQQFLGQRYAGLSMVSSGGDLSDLYLMSLCRHFVISNSTYSWWAAYFAEPKGGLIVCPQEWVTQPGVASPCPDRWLKVPGAVRPIEADAEATAQVARQIHAARKGQAQQAWFKDLAFQQRRTHFPHLNADSVVIDVGAFKGDWLHEMNLRHGCRLYALEPIRPLALRILQRFAGQPNVKVFNFALGAGDTTTTMRWTAPGKGEAKAQADVQQVEVKPVQALMAAEGLDRIDLLKVSLGHGAFELVEHLLDSGLIAQVQVLQVQFDDTEPEAPARREAIARRLAATHRCAWNHYFVCEQWERA